MTAAHTASLGTRHAALGVNIDGRGAAVPSAVRSAFGPRIPTCGAAWVRMVLLPDVDTRRIVSLYQSVGLKVLGVVARESGGSAAAGTEFPSWEAAAEQYRKRVGTILDAIQIGNEPDHESPSSWTLSAQQINELARTFHGFKQRIGPGLVSGHPEYAEDLDPSLFDAIAVHPYGRSPVRDWPYPSFGYVLDLLDRYAAVSRARLRGIPLWVTECGTDERTIQAKYVGEMMRTLCSPQAVQLGVEAAFHFCWSDRSGVEPFGLLDVNDRPKAAHAAFYEATHADPDGEEGDEDMAFNVSQPMLDKMKAAGDAPASDERYDGFNNSVCAGKKYLWTYDAKANVTYKQPAWDLPLA